MTRRLVLAGLLTVSGALAPVPQAGAKSLEDELLKLSPEARVEQSCNNRVSGTVRQEHAGFAPDEVIAYAFADDKVEGDRVLAPGAALRSHGKWYRVSYDCQTARDGLDVASFSYQLGNAVPRNEWEAHYLVE